MQTRTRRRRPGLNPLQGRPPLGRIPVAFAISLQVSFLTVPHTPKSLKNTVGSFKTMNNLYCVNHSPKVRFRPCSASHLESKNPVQKLCRNWYPWLDTRFFGFQAREEPSRASTGSLSVSMSPPSGVFWASKTSQNALSVPPSGLPEPPEGINNVFVVGKQQNVSPRSTLCPSHHPKSVHRTDLTWSLQV